MPVLKVLDACPVVAFLEGDPCADQGRVLLLRAEEGKVRLAMTVLNLGEVWYAVARADSPEQSDRLIREIRGMAVEIVGVDRALTREAARLKARRGVSFADCFAAALARTRKAELITGDREFLRLEGEVKIAWL